MNLYLGIDFGTSGARIALIDDSGEIQHEGKHPFEIGKDIFTSWSDVLFNLIKQIPQKIRSKIRSIALDGTSSTVLLCDVFGNLIEQPLMYNDGRGVEVMETLKIIAPANHTVISATSSLAKLLWLIQNLKITSPEYYLSHQADWLAFLLHGQIGISDYHNALKLGYDVGNLCYPKWLEKQQLPVKLPKIVAPGTPIATILPPVAQRLDLPKNCVVCAGTTDSIAAFLATGAKMPGEAATSLGSTLVLKLLSRNRIDNLASGIYSHRLGDLWLVGGASNVGGAVLRHFFDDAELTRLSSQIDADSESPLHYYPLLKPGERFPINDPYLTPSIEPKPINSVDFLHGLLESMARIESQGYQLLQQLGATQVSHVYTTGGGATNPSWTTIRKRHLKVPILPPVQSAAAYGAALLAKQGYNKTLTLLRT